MVKTNMFKWKRADIINEEKCLIFLKSLSLPIPYSQNSSNNLRHLKNMDLQSELIWNMDGLSLKRRYLFIGYSPCQLFPFNIPLNVGRWGWGVAVGESNIHAATAGALSTSGSTPTPTPFYPVPDPDTFEPGEKSLCEENWSCCKALEKYCIHFIESFSRQKILAGFKQSHLLSSFLNDNNNLECHNIRTLGRRIQTQIL